MPVVYITLYLNHASIKKKKKSKIFYFKLRKKKFPIELIGSSVYLHYLPFIAQNLEV